jgi:hypothetical protein
MRQTLVTLGLMIVSAIVGAVVRPILDPVFTPTLTTLLPTLWEQLQLFVESQNQKAVAKLIQYAAAGYGEGTVVLYTRLQIFAYIVVFVSIGSTAFVLPQLQNFKTEARRKIVGGILLLVAFAFMYLAYRESNEFPIQLVAMQMTKIYQRNLAIVSPYISIQEERELNSLWALMKNRDDVQQIDKKIKSIADQHGLSW